MSTRTVGKGYEGMTSARWATRAVTGATSGWALLAGWIVGGFVIFLRLFRWR